MRRPRSTARLWPALECLEERSLLSTVPGPPPVSTDHVHIKHPVEAARARLAQERHAHTHHKPSPVERGNGAGTRVGTGSGLTVSAGNGVGVGGGVGNSNGGGNSNSNGRGMGAGTGVWTGSGTRFGVGMGVGASALTLDPDNGLLIPPFGQVLADTTPPVPGAVYNVALVAVRNGTSQTFSAQNGFSVGVSGASGAQRFPTGPSLWKPGQVLVFYSLDQDTFPPGFAFNFQGTSTQVPADIYYGIQYSPNTLPGILNSLVSTLVVGGRYELVSQ